MHKKSCAALNFYKHLFILEPALLDSFSIFGFNFLVDIYARYCNFALGIENI